MSKIARAAKSQGKTWHLRRQGANHEVWELDGLVIPIARHSEFGNRAAEMIWRECEEKLGKDWWRS